MYSEIIKINEQFKSSVNIEYDLADYKKLSEYIPTEDICEVIKYYINSINDSKNNRSTILEGPYGKGKSYLILSLLQLFTIDNKNKNYELFLDKLNKTNSELCKEIKKIKNKNLKLLPIIVNGNYSSLQQALSIGLKEALQRERLEDIYPDTAFEICLKIISQWEKDKTMYENIIHECSSSIGEKIEDIKIGLKNYDSHSYESFTKLYNCVINGLEFNPLVNSDVIKNYKDITYKLTKHGYNGVFVVFDEFSKFIELENENITKDLKTLQDLAEVANRSSNTAQMHLCCITHKSLESYYRNKKESIANAFRTVEGRFKEIRFNRSLNQNYEIVSFSLQKNKDFESKYKKIFKINKEFYNAIDSLNIFNEINKNVLYKDCFPLNPLTTYSVINISEKIAQNERTLFTFISDNDTNSLSTFIKNQDSGLFNVDKIYDYFSNLIEKSDDELIRKIYYKTAACLSKTGSLLEKQIIKVIAIINIVNNDLLIANKEIISLCLNRDKNEILKALNNLKDEKLLKINAYNESYDFSGAGSKIIDLSIDAYISKYGKNENLSNTLNSLFDSNYVLPHKYNTEYKMTRFYREKYITDLELNNLKSFSQSLNEEFCDGLIYRVIKTKNISNLEIKKHFNEMKDNERVILKVLNLDIQTNIINQIFRTKGLQAFLNNSKNNDELINSEAEALLKDEIAQLENYLDKLYSNNNIELISIKENKKYNELLSELMQNVYGLTPVINNEMINIESDVSQNYIKARNIVVDLFLNKKINCTDEKLENYSETGPENTVYISIKEKTSDKKRKVLDDIKMYFSTAEEKKENSLNLIEKLKSSPYGIRSGVIPLLIAMAIDEMDDTIILFYENREIDLDAENLNKLILNPSKYYFLAEKGTNERKNYLASLLKCFGLISANNYRDDIKQVVNYLQRWFMGLPRIVRSANIKNNFLSLDWNFIKIKDMFLSFNINEHETIFEKLPSVFDMNFNNTVKYLSGFQKIVDNSLAKYTLNLTNNIKYIYKRDEKSSLYNSINEWIEKNKANERLLEDKEKDFISLFKNKNYNDALLLNDISIVIIGTQVTDWEKDNSTDLLDFIKNLISTIENKKYISEIIPNNKEIENKNFSLNISPMGQMLLSNIEDVMEEYGESITSEEKINILKNLINKII